MAAILRIKDENGNIVSVPAIKGDKGEKGDRGLPGSGGVPDGGTTGQVLTKNSNADGDAGWKDSPKTEFSDDGSGNISVNGASSDAKRFLNSLTVPGLGYKYVNPINSGTYASPYGVYISGGTVIDYVTGLKQVGFYTAYVNRKVTDIPDAAKAANSSLRGFVCVSQIDNTASGGSTKCYAYIVLIDQNSNFYIQYIQGSAGGGWKRMYPYETAENALAEKLDKNQGTGNAGKVLTVGSDGIVVPDSVDSYTLPVASSTTLGGVKIGSGITVGDDGTISASGGENEWKQLMDYTVTDDDVANSVSTFMFQTQDNAEAKEIYLLIDWKVVSNANCVVKGGYYNNNNNYIANVINGYGARNNKTMLWHLARKELNGLSIIDWEWSPDNSQNSDLSGKFNKTGLWSLSQAPMNGVTIHPYSYANVDGNVVEYGLLAGTRFRGWWR